MIDNNNNDNNNDNNNLDNVHNLKNFNPITKIQPKLKFYSSGSFGVVLCDEINNQIYKITLFSNIDEINENNFVEMIYLNYFKNKYKNMYEVDTDTNTNTNTNANTFLPIQNLSTSIYYFDDFIELYKLDEQISIKIINILKCLLTDIIIVNKMKYYPYDLSKFIKKKQINSDNIMNIIENLILGLHLIHSNNFAHGDLKSRNIVLDKNNTKIIDFGGIKSIFNPKYECTCTSTYRSPEDYSWEYRKIKENTVYKNNSIKSDIWSLGIVIYEMIFEFNPISLKYYNIKNENGYGDGDGNGNGNGNEKNEKHIEKKINEYFTTINQIEILENDKTKFNNKSNEEQFMWFKITKLVENLLICNCDSRLNLDQIYLELFLKEIPNFKITESKFNYSIDITKFNKIFKFRKYYYKIILNIMLDCKELFLYPMLANLFDRFLIVLFTDIEKEANIGYNTYIPKHIFSSDYSNFSSDYSNFSKSYLITENIIYYDLENLENLENLDDLDDLDDLEKKGILEEYVFQKNHLGIITCTFYLMVKILILKRVDKIHLELFKFYKLFSRKFMEEQFVNIFYYLVSNFVYIANKLNWNIPRPKLYFYKNTDIDKIVEIIKIIENFDIDKMNENIE